jgi:hypothetical protein
VLCLCNLIHFRSADDHQDLANNDHKLLPLDHQVSSAILFELLWVAFTEGMLDMNTGFEPVSKRICAGSISQTSALI